MIGGKIMKSMGLTEASQENSKRRSTSRKTQPQVYFRVTI
jgi:hypothetical protein